jgi:L-rhamnose-H+ transport protein
MGSTTSGIAILLLAGIMNASFTLPMKFTRNWRWENIWSAWSVWALLIMPPAAALLTVPRLSMVYARAGVGNVLLVAVCGLGWGIAQVLFGLAVDAIGIALAFSIVLGLSAAMGSLLPLIRLHPEKVFTPAGFGVMTGVLLVLAGVAVCAVAGRKREKAAGATTEGNFSVSTGLLFATVGGIAAAAMNFGVAFGQPLIDSAQAAGAGPVWSSSAVWVPLLAAGAVPNLVYCIFLMKKNRAFGNFGVRGTGSYWGLAALMAFLWFFSTLLYGVASGKLGELGPVLGWPFFMSLIVIVASLLSVMTGEWKNAGRGPLLIQMTGVGILVIAVIVLSQAGRYV